MEREDSGREPRAGNAQTHQQTPDEKRVRNVQSKIYDMISERIETPQRVLNPECRINQREILRRRIERKPDAPQSVRGRQERVTSQIHVIVPNEPAVQGGQICGDRQEDKKDRADPDRFGDFFDWGKNWAFFMEVQLLGMFAEVNVVFLGARLRRGGIAGLACLRQQFAQ